jgi:glycosyltransferase involved in cell wall biosynthesis
VIYICIPALNEAPTVGVLLWRIRQVMTEFRRDFHLIVLDDGSSDATSEVLAPYARVLPLTLLRNDRPQGYAAALERVLREAAARSTHPRRDTAVVMQADFTEMPESIPLLVKRLEGGADVVGSSLSVVQGEVTRGMRWSRRALPWLLSRAALPAEVGDPFLSFRAYRVQVIKRALQDREGAPLLTRQGWAANAELLLRVAPHVRRADQIPVEIRYTRRERETRFDGWAALRETWELARRAPRRGKALAVAPEPPPQPAEAAAEPSDEGRPPRRRRKRGNREGNIQDRTEGPDRAGD